MHYIGVDYLWFYIHWVRTGGFRILGGGGVGPRGRAGGVGVTIPWTVGNDGSKPRAFQISVTMCVSLSTFMESARRSFLISPIIFDSVIIYTRSIHRSRVFKLAGLYRGETGSNILLSV